MLVPRHAGRHRLAHDDDQRPRRARLGRRRHRGRGGDARPADVDADPAGRRLQARRRAARGRDGHRPRADRHADAAQARRGRQVRRVLRPGHPEPAARRPRDDRQHVARSSARPARSSRSTPRRCATWSSPGRPTEQVERVEAYAKAQGLWHDEDAEEPTYSETLELDLGDVVPSLAGPKRPQDRVSLTESKARSACALEELVPDGARPRHDERRVEESFPASRPARPRTATRAGHDHEPRRPGAGTGGVQVAERARARRPRDARGRHGDRARPRARGDRRDHVVHEHVEPDRDDRRRPARPQRGRARPDSRSRG